ncbi:phospholipase A [Catenovulum adriaticum]|uniref:Phospholipase A1 n=1 Tax=Catenovulum adriaticum TaxID=2984846 RepID=A0ABY7AK15_9ALTE|nr:phospholipase A [Catenovulum sp. TS8]WAJ69471.1 phospholipase A [Catenovulum sp. TS8]
MHKILPLSLALYSLLTSHNLFAQYSDQQACYLKTIQEAEKDTAVTDVIDKCKHEDEQPHLGAISERISAERETYFSPYVITPHKMNYILPVTHTSGFNDKIEVDDGVREAARPLEAKFQISFKVPLNHESIFTEGDALFFGLTMQSWWQLYTEAMSKPFRETNYQPEIFYYLPVNWQLLNTHTSLAFGLEHQSNGRSLPYSRSWNRVYLSVIVEDEAWALTLRPWWRLPESKTKEITDPTRDDNPDIAKYMGYFELNGAYRIDQNMQGHFMVRQNLNHGKGAIELGVTFPLWGRVTGYLQYFNGYGESLIDYNYSQQRIGLGIALTSLL